MIKVDDNLMWESYMEESRLGKLAAGAALGGSLIGGTIGMSAPDNNYKNQPSSIQQSQDKQEVAPSAKFEVDVDKFVSLWSRYYQTSQDSKKEKNARILASEDIKVPMDARRGIYDAVYILGGDMDVDPEVLRDVLEKTGYVESLRYTTKRQSNNGPARGYWQVEPSTALDLIKNSRALFGNKFKRAFGRKADIILNLEQGSDSDSKYIQKELERDVSLAATFAAAKWIVAASSELKELK